MVYASLRLLCICGVVLLFGQGVNLACLWFVAFGLIAFQVYVV